MPPQSVSLVHAVAGVRVQCLVANGASVQSAGPVAAEPASVSVLPLQLETANVLVGPSGLAFGAVAVLPPPPTYRQLSPRSKSFVVPAVSL